MNTLKKQLLKDSFSPKFQLLQRHAVTKQELLARQYADKEEAMNPPTIKKGPLDLKDVCSRLGKGFSEMSQIIGASIPTFYKYRTGNNLRTSSLIRRIRYSRGESQKEFAEALNITAQEVKKMELDNVPRDPWVKIIDIISEITQRKGAKLCGDLGTSPTLMSRWRAGNLKPYLRHLSLAAEIMEDIKHKFPTEKEYNSYIALFDKVELNDEYRFDESN